MKAKKKYLLTISILLVLIIALTYLLREEKNKRKMPLEIYHSNLKKESKNLFVQGICGEEEIGLMDLPSFKEENLLTYAKYRQLKPQWRVYLVNNHIINEQNKDDIIALSKDSYFLLPYINRYLAFKKGSVRQRIELVNADRDYKVYADIKKADLSKDFLVNVNKYYYLPQDYEPSDLVVIDSKYGFPGKIREEVYKAYVEMEKEARKEGLSLEVNSAYRSYQRQVELYSAYSNIDGQDVADTYSARPGFSDHQSGCAMDILSPGYDFGDFYRSKEAEWLAANSYKFGFIIRYPLNKEEVTGYKYEPWHLRYLGKKVAREVYEKKLSYDEYYAYYIKLNKEI